MNTTSTPKIGSQVAAVYRLNIGSIEVTALGDGHFTMPIAMLPMATPEEAADINARNFLPDGPEFEGSINGYLINTGTELTLIDAGARDYLQPTVGKLPESLEAAGHTPDQVDRIVLTHMHPDHIGGVANKDGSKVFPNATLHVHEADHAFFLDADIKASFPEDMAVFFDCAEASVNAYKDDISLFTFGDDLGGGLTVLDMAGHTPGHSGFCVASGSDELIILGDIVHATALQMARPDWGVVFDTDPEKAVAARVRAFQDAARNKRLIAGMHLPFPGIGHVSQVGAGFQFHSLNWAFDL